MSTPDSVEYSNFHGLFMKMKARSIEIDEEFALFLIFFAALLLGGAAGTAGACFVFATGVWVHGSKNSPFLPSPKLLRYAESAPGKALTAVCGPSALGLLVVTVLTLIYNEFGDDNLATIRTIEQYAVRFDSLVSKWLKPSPKEFAALLVVLLIASYLVPRWGLMSRTLRVKNSAGTLVATVAMVTNFTFFTNQAIVAPVDQKIVARYREARKNKEKSIARYLSVEVVNTAARASNGDSRRSTLKLAEYLRTKPDPWGEYWMNVTARYIAGADTAGIGAPGKLDEDVAPADASLREHLAQADQEEALAEKAMEQADHAEQDLKQFASEMASISRDALSEGLLRYLAATVEAVEPAMAEPAKEFANKLLEHLIEPTKTKAVDAAIQVLVKAWTARGERMKSLRGEALDRDFLAVEGSAVVVQGSAFAKKSQDLMEDARNASREGKGAESERLAIEAGKKAAAAQKAVEFTEQLALKTAQDSSTPRAILPPTADAAPIHLAEAAAATRATVDKLNVDLREVTRVAKESAKREFEIEQKKIEQRKAEGERHGPR